MQGSFRFVFVRRRRSRSLRSVRTRRVAGYTTTADRPPVLRIPLLRSWTSRISPRVNSERLVAPPARARPCPPVPAQTRPGDAPLDGAVLCQDHRGRVRCVCLLRRVDDGCDWRWDWQYTITVQSCVEGGKWMHKILTNDASDGIIVLVD